MFDIATSKLAVARKKIEAYGSMVCELQMPLLTVGRRAWWDSS